MASRSPARVLYVLLDLLLLLIGLRLALKFLGASAAADFTRFIYGLSDPFVTPFTGIIASARVGTAVIEWSAVVAIAVYVIAGYVIFKVMALFLPPIRSERTVILDEADDDFHE